MTSATVAGSAKPRFRSVPAGAVSSAGAEAVELAASCGLVLDGWQADVLSDALAEVARESERRWAALEVGLVVPRQNGKGAILEARELAGLFLFDERLILHSAHEFKTAQEAFRRVLALVQSNPDLDKEVLRVRTSHGEEGIELRSGARLRFVARSTGSGRGFTGDTVILDEAYNLSSEAMGALFPTLSARPNPQIWYTSSAPLQTAVSQVLRDFCRRGRKGESARLVYVEFCADRECDQDDRAAWAAANPALGTRITEEFIEVERDALLDEFARERLGIWDDEEDAGERVIPAAAWEACRDAKSGPVGPVAFALDVTPARSAAAFAVAGESGHGGTHVEVVDHRPGTDWLVARAVELQDRHGGVLAVAKGSPAASLLVELERAGVRVLVVSTEDHAQACGRLFDGVTQRTVRHLGQPELSVAVDGADRKFYGDSWLWARRLSSVDISPLVAATLAMWAFEQAPAPVMAAPEAIIL